MPITIGSAVPGLTWEITNTDGTLVDPSTVTLNVFRPGSSSPVPVDTHRVTTGVWAGQYIATESGRHTYIWVGSGAFTGTHLGTFTVESSGSLVSIDEAVAHLGAGKLFDDPTRRDRLQALCLAATRACESYVRRPLAVRSFTEVHSGDCAGIHLRRGPVVAVSSVNEAGVALAGSDYQVDPEAGVLYRGAPGQRSWASGFRNVAVTYSAGFTDPPADLRLAVLREVEHLWQRTQNAPHPGMGGDGYDEMMRDVQSAMPWPVRYLLDPYADAGGFA